MEKICASAIERTDELSNSSRALRHFGTSSPTSERKRQRICVQAETDVESMFKQRPLAVRDKKKKPQHPKTMQELEKFMLESRKERFLNSNFASLLIHTQSSLFTCIWYEGLLVSKHFCRRYCICFCLN